MAKFKAKCPVCRNSIKGETPPVFCKYCNADLLHPENESIQKRIISMQYDGWQGSLILTNRRLLFFRVTRSGSGGTIGGGIIAVASLSELQNQRLSFSIPMGTIQSVEIVKHGLFGLALLVRVNDGAMHQLPVSKKHIEEWKDTILRLNTYQ